MSTRWTDADLDAARRRLGQLSPCGTPAASSSRRKYGNQPEDLDGHRFDSKLERRRYQELLTMQAAQVITELQVHPEFGLHSPTLRGNLERIGAYVADFSYRRDGKLVIEDCKSSPTRKSPLYRLKKRMVECEYGIEVIEIMRVKA